MVFMVDLNFAIRFNFFYLDEWHVSLRMTNPSALNYLTAEVLPGKNKLTGLSSYF